MDRQIVYPGSIPLDTDLLNTQRNGMVALGYLAQLMLGNGPVLDGLACTPTAPASLSFTVGPGSIAVLNVIDTLAFGSLPADSLDPLVKIGINSQATSFSCVAPTTSGQSVNYLIEASLQEADVTPVVLPYYNAANPTQPFSGPTGSGAAQNTQRVQRVQLQMKSGVPATTGSQVTPPVDNGWVGLYAIVVNYGQSQILPASIQPLPAAPFLPFKLPMLAPGFSRIQTFVSSQLWVVPANVTRVKVRLVGGGGGGGGGTSGYGGGGGGAGGYAEGVFSVIPGSAIDLVVGAGGAGSSAGSLGGTGGTSGFGTLNSATGGGGGASAAPASPGGAGGQGFSAPIIFAGGFGGDGQYAGLTFAAGGGASAFGGGGRGASGGGSYTIGQAPGSGGGGCYALTGSGGAGAAGIIIVEY